MEMKITYESLDAAVEDLAAMLPMMEQIYRQMPPGEAERTRTHAIINLLRDPAKLRERLKIGLKPDGTVEWGFTEEAEKLLREKMGPS